MERRITKRRRPVVVCHGHELRDDARRYSFCAAPAPPSDAELDVSGHLGSLTGSLQHLFGSRLSIRRTGTGLPDRQGQRAAHGDHRRLLSRRVTRGGGGGVLRGGDFLWGAVAPRLADAGGGGGGWFCTSDRAGRLVRRFPPRR